MISDCRRDFSGDGSDAAELDDSGSSVCLGLSEIGVAGLARLGVSAVRILFHPGGFDCWAGGTKGVVVEYTWVPPACSMASLNPLCIAVPWTGNVVVDDD